jgi:hypothetical protein
MLTTLKIKSICNTVLLIFTLSLFFSCQKDLSFQDGGPAVTPPDLSTRISSSVSGFVTDENDAAVVGATVQFGTSNITTDKYGYFEAKNVQVVKEAAVVTVSKPGYFKGIKTYMAKEGKTAFFRIKLMPKTNIGTINATSGGMVALPNGLSIKLLAGSIVNVASNAVYTGTVNVAAFWINPTAADLNKIMPGDLRGINTEGSLKLLQTFSMVAVELTGASGELLQIVNGQKATLTLPIPSSLLATTPANIPLWYFDEAKGLWKEEGKATKTGNTYVGNVSHFSFWSQGLPGPYVQFDCTVKDAAGNPVPDALVNVEYSSVNNNTWGWGYTDPSGYISGLITANAQLTLKIFTYGSCPGIPLYYQTITTANSNISLGNLTIASNNIATVTGTLKNCAGQLVTNGCIIVEVGNQYYYRYNVNSNGSFSFNRVICPGSTVVDIIGQDNTTLQEGFINNYTLVTGNNNIGDLLTCGNSIQEYVNYTVNGTPFSVVPPIGTISEYDTVAINSRVIYGFDSNINAYANFGISKSNIGPGSVQNLTLFGSAQTGYPATITTPISVNITEYGNIGQFISGNFSGTVTSVTPPNTTYTITCSFRSKRTF